ncbi:hypothetical protein Taro_006995 [Colocasia esculenta]|uniref:Uncharacterized protein n=1 Tax=Colocasia esculenta TaxID=4460 RepID=A0A843TTY8_COLES|nr:hypothetical protein [Colocasia esculenta]
MPSTSRDPGLDLLESDDTDLDGTAQVPGQSPELQPGSQRTWGTQLERSEGVQEDDTDLNGTTLYRDKP